MLRIDVTTLISRPVQEVWDYFIDLTNSPRWTRSGSELRPTSEGAFGVGTTVESVRTVFGREIKSQTLVATHYDPGRLISFTADVPLLGRLIGGFTFESVGVETRPSVPDDLGRNPPRALLLRKRNVPIMEGASFRVPGGGSTRMALAWGLTYTHDAAMVLHSRARGDAFTNPRALHGGPARARTDQDQVQ